MILAVALVALLISGPAQTAAAPPEHSFVLTGAGRFAVLADLSSIAREGDLATMRAFQVAEPGFVAAGNAYWGGWSRWRFDCAAVTADRLDFASVREGGAEGPATPDPAPAYAAAPGGDAAELLAVACAPVIPAAEVTTLEAAVALGRAALAGDPALPR